MTSLRGKKLGILISSAPTHRNFLHGLSLAESALKAEVTVFLYCIDEAVFGVGDARLQDLKARGVRLFACADAAQKRNITMTDAAAYSGLTVVNELIAATDRFVSFNQS